MGVVIPILMMIKLTLRAIRVLVVKEKSRPFLLVVTLPFSIDINASVSFGPHLKRRHFGKMQLKTKSVNLESFFSNVIEKETAYY